MLWVKLHENGDLLMDHYSNSLLSYFYSKLEISAFFSHVRVFGTFSVNIASPSTYFLLFPFSLWKGETKTHIFSLDWLSKEKKLSLMQFMTHEK